MKKLLLALCLIFWAIPAQAQFTKPPGLLLPSVQIPDYNLTVSVWAYDTGFVGKYLGVFELHNDGLWYGCNHNMTPDDQFDQHVAEAGGPGAWLATVGMGEVNRALKECYPAITGTPGEPPPSSAGVVGQVNYALQSYKLTVVNGQAVISPK